MQRLRHAFFGIVLLATTATAHAAGRLGVADAWIRAAPPGARMLAGYAILKNEGDQPLSILSVHSDAFRMASLHESVVEDGVAKMRELNRLALAPGETVRLAPGGKHLMLMQPRRELAIADAVEVTFLLADGTRVETSFAVHAPDAPGAESGGAHDHH